MNVAGAAQSIGELIGFRALQGLGAGGLMTLAMAIVADIVPPRERGRYQGYIQMVFVLAGVAVFGTIFANRLDVAASDVSGDGAAVIDALHTVFLVAAPIAALALLAVLFLKEVPLRTAPAPR